MAKKPIRLTKRMRTALAGREAVAVVMRQASERQEWCRRCGAALTFADRQRNACTQCQTPLKGIMMTDNICVRVPRSRRKLDYFLSYLGRKPEFLYSFRFTGNFVYVTPDEYQRVKPYVTRARVDFDKLLKCWNG